MKCIRTGCGKELTSKNCNYTKGQIRVNPYLAVCKEHDIYMDNRVIFYIQDRQSSQENKRESKKKQLIHLLNR